MKKATGIIINIGLLDLAKPNTAIYINRPQKIPNTIFSKKVYELRNSVILTAAALTYSPTGVVRISNPQNTAPTKLPNQISINYHILISFVINKPALPVKRLNLK